MVGVRKAAASSELREQLSQSFRAASCLRTQGLMLFGNRLTPPNMGQLYDARFDRSQGDLCKEQWRKVPRGTR